MTTLAVVGIGIAPFVSLVGFVWLVDRLRRQREQRYARQIAVTDAVHRELGSAAAPVVRRRLDGRWEVSMEVPLDRPAMVGALVRIAERVSATWEASRGRPAEIVLRPATTRPGPMGISGREGDGRRPGRAPLAPAVR